MMKPLDTHKSTDDEQHEVNLFLEGIYELSGFDFSEYNRNHIIRRLNFRMNLESCSSLTLLFTEISKSPLLLQQIINDFSIQVTSMFRNPLFFQNFRKNILPHLVQFPEIFIWHAGCSTGEEAYSMAILLKEEGLLDRARIYATDISEEAIDKARKGIFPLHRMNDYTNNYVLAGGREDFSNYYDTDASNAYFHASLSRSIFFEQHNLAIDGSFNEFHVILCRNVCIYFNEDLQNHVYHLFEKSMHPDGFLCLGNQEALISIQSKRTFKEYDTNHKIYKLND